MNQRIKKFLKLLFFLNIIFFSSGCTDLFSTREDKVEKPDPGSTSGIFEAATSPEIVLNNLSRSLEQKNVSKYMENFADPTDFPLKPFRFVGDANYQDQLAQEWTYTDEQNYFNNVVFNSFGKSPSIRFTYVDSLPNTTPINLLAFDDSVETDFFKYQLIVEASDTTLVFSGLSKFKMFRSRETAREIWYIYNWSDRSLENEQLKTWTYLKIQNR
ncbi:MAG: hypothetical protein KDF60_10125 [Calditrichaeota bacterium]|nr:hypothetical protein [Calditrichota bacterium]